VKRRSAFLAAALLLAPLWFGCATARRGEPLRGPMVLDEKATRGQRVFANFCNGCHPGGEGGLGPALNNKPMPTFVTKFQVRHGLGAMPSFSESAISDAALDDLTAYLGRLRHHRAKP
jgi:mono/diheme cytochrome c family protein